MRGRKVLSPKSAAPCGGKRCARARDLRSENGVLKVELTYRNFVDANGQMRYCYLSKNGSQAPTLRRTGRRTDSQPQERSDGAKSSSIPEIERACRFSLRDPPCRLKGPLCGVLPKDQVHLVLARESSQPSAAHEHQKSTDCARSEMTPDATNIHFHGLNIPPVCHQDDVMNTMIEPGDPPFEYRFKSRRTSLPACIGITRTCMASRRCK